MKRIYILIASLLGWVQISTAQAYRPFLVDSAHWTISEFFCVGYCDPGGGPFDNGDFNYTNTIQLKIDGDTIIQGISYKKLIQNLDRTCMCPSNGNPGPYPSGHFPCNTLAILWEDTIARKVYIKKVNEPYAQNWCVQDSVLFDFSKSAGDSMNWAVSCINEDSFFVDSINQSLPWLWTGSDQDTVKTWYLDNKGPYGRFTLYESIGSSLGFWGWRPSFEGSYESFLINYCVGSDSVCGFSCDLTLGIINPSSQQVSIAVYPNPTKDILTLDITNMASNENLKFILSDILGQEIYDQTLINAKTEVDISTFQSGIYLWHLLSDKNIIRSGKIVHD